MDGEGSHRSKTEWTTPQKARVKSLYPDSHMSKKAITGTIPGMTRTTVRNILNSDTARRTGKDRAGRPHVLTPKKVDQVIEFLEKIFQRRILPWKTLASECGLNCSADILKCEVCSLSQAIYLRISKATATRICDGI